MGLLGKRNQITVYKEIGIECLKYVEDISKTNHGVLNKKIIKRKEVVQHANLENKQCCHVTLFKLYMSHLPEYLNTDSIYLQAVIGYAKTNIWYLNKPMGHNSLSTVSNISTFY